MTKQFWKRKGNNPRGSNQYSNVDRYNPWNLRLARARIMLDDGASTREIQGVTGLSKQSLTNLRQGKYNVPSAMVESLRQCEADKFTYAAHQILDTIIDPTGSGDLIEKASLVQRSTAVGILYDKARLARNEPTSIQHVEVTPAEIEAEIVRIKREIVEMTSMTDDEYIAAEVAGQPEEPQGG